MIEDSLFQLSADNYEFSCKSNFFNENIEHFSVHACLIVPTLKLQK